MAYKRVIVIDEDGSMAESQKCVLLDIEGDSVTVYPVNVTEQEFNSVIEALAETL